MIAEELGFKKKENISEVDEYFTDINSVFVENRTCLRLRNTNNKELELTFKGKSKDLSNAYAKLENNIKLSLNDYEKIKILFFNLGYYSYSIVKKERQIYTKREDSLTYNLVIDNIKDIGSFVEFEILAAIDLDIETVYKKLDKLIESFKEIEFKEASLPYRDFVAKEIYNEIKPKDKLKTIIFDLDNILDNKGKELETILLFKLLKQIKQKNINLELITKESVEDIELMLKNFDSSSLFNNISNDYNEKCKKDETISFVEIVKNNDFSFETLIRKLFYIINFN